MELTPPLPGPTLLVFLLQIAVLLLTAVCLGRVSVRLGMPAVVGELSTGVLLGPSLLGSAAPALTGWLLPVDAAQAHLLDAVGQLGALLLVGLAGAQLDIGLLRRRRTAAVRISIAALVLPVLLGVAAGLLAPAALRAPGAGVWAFALFAGVVLGVSAIPVIAKTLSDLRLADHPVAHLTLCAAAVADTVAWFLLSVAAALAVGGGAGSALWALVSLAGFVVAAVTVGPPLTRYALTAASRAGTGPAVVLVLLMAAGSHALGLEAILAPSSPGC